MKSGDWHQPVPALFAATDALEYMAFVPIAPDGTRVHENGARHAWN